MKRTRKWAFLRQEAERLVALGLTTSQIATRLEVDSSTVRRWFLTRKLVRGKAVAEPSSPGAMPSAEQWAKAVRETYNLDATDEQLVTLATKALTLAQSEAEGVTAQLQAMGRFQALVKQLALVARATGEETSTPTSPQRTTRARPTVDPRTLLKAV